MCAAKVGPCRPPAQPLARAPNAALAPTALTHLQQTHPVLDVALLLLRHAKTAARVQRQSVGETQSRTLKVAAQLAPCARVLSACLCVSCSLLLPLHPTPRIHGTCLPANITLSHLHPTINYFTSHYDTVCALSHLHPEEDGPKYDGTAQVAHEASHGSRLVTRDLAPAALQQQPELPARRTADARHSTPQRHTCSRLRCRSHLHSSACKPCSFALHNCMNEAAPSPAALLLTQQEAWLTWPNQPQGRS